MLIHKMVLTKHKILLVNACNHIFMKLYIKSALLFLAVLYALWAILPDKYAQKLPYYNAQKELKYTLGLDIAGGTELDYKLDLSEVDRKNNDNDLTNDISSYDVNSLAESVRDALEVRVNPAGVSETIVKRAKVEGEEHVLLQIPPTLDVSEIKKIAERDNTLTFYEEDRDLLNSTLATIESEITLTNPDNWTTQVDTLTTQNNDRWLVEHTVVDKKSIDTIRDDAFKTALTTASAGTILPQSQLITVFKSVPLSESKIALQLPDDMKSQANIMIEEPIRRDVSIVYLKDKTTEKKSVPVAETVEAQHILFSYKGAERAIDSAYATKDEAYKKALEVLNTLKSDSSNFTDIAKLESKDATAKDNGGDLGKVSKGQMTAKFEEALFNTDTIGILPELVETEFGYHIIDITKRNPATTEEKDEVFVSYETIGWNADELNWRITELGGKQLEKAVPSLSQANRPEVVLLFDEEGRDIFTALSRKIASRTCQDVPTGSDPSTVDKQLLACRIGIKVGSDFISTPTVMQEINTSQVVISGNFTIDSARELARNLNLGAIDAPVKLVSETTLQPDLGALQLQKTMKAVLIGMGVIMLYLIFQYRFAGVIASVALAIYALFYMALLKLSGTPTGVQFGGPLVITLAGLAGIAISNGLAMDGIILIFERIREELKNNKPLTTAINIAFEKASSAIWDSNITSIIISLVLFVLGKSVVKGFAMTLILGAILVLFNAFTITRILMNLAMKTPLARYTSFFINK